MWKPIACRSMLMTCSLHTQQYSKAEEVGADISTLDLEDSVPMGSKEEARRLAFPFLAARRPPGTGGVLRALRPNTLHSEEGLRDLLGLIDAGARPDILMMPKVESAAELVLLDQVLERVPDIVFFPLIETAKGIQAIDEIATAPRVRGLILGLADLSANLSSSMVGEHMAYARTRMIYAAAAHGLQALDSPCFELHDPDALQMEIERAAQMGFSGKVSVHPKHIGTINAGFTPNPEEVDRARRVLGMIRGNQGRISVIDGLMIGPPAVMKAERLLAIADRLTLGEKIVSR
ncbi:MAG TPA: CoA ester lyase [Thermoanaerobaculia bacterium]